jgi:hypothetical protein
VCCSSFAPLQFSSNYSVPVTSYPRCSASDVGPASANPARPNVMAGLCPYNHPHPFDQGRRCCSSPSEGLDADNPIKVGCLGSQLLPNSTCCHGQEVSCPKRYCKPNGRRLDDSPRPAEATWTSGLGNWSDCSAKSYCMLERKPSSLPCPARP